MNTFLSELEKQPTGRTENGALAYSTTSSALLDYFSNLNNFYRDYEEVAADLDNCWAEDPLNTLRTIVYCRAITRSKTKFKLLFSDIELVLPTKGAGLKNEGRLGLRWLYLKHRLTFLNNISSIISVGCFSDLWHRDFVDAWVEAEDKEIAYFIALSLKNDLSLKFLPRYKSSSNIARKAKSIETIKFHKTRNKGLRLVLEQVSNISVGKISTMKGLMKLKSSGKAHQWQQKITEGNFESINFNNLPGKVLGWITNEDSNGESFLARHGLEEKYIKWLDSKETLNTTSFLHEIAKPVISKASYGNSINKITTYTVNKQVATILNRVGKSNLNVMPVIDTSGSMTCEVHNSTTALDICLSLGVYFSMKQNGSFKDSIISFNSTSKFKKLEGSYVDRLEDILRDPDYMGSTNFQSVIDLIVRTRKSNPSIPIEEYPDVYLVISDMQFNPTGLYNADDMENTNHERALQKLDAVGLPRPLFIWYNVSPYGNNNFQNHKDDKGVLHMSGFDTAAIERLMSEDFTLAFEEESGKSIKEITPYEAYMNTIEQDYLELFNV